MKGLDGYNRDMLKEFASADEYADEILKEVKSRERITKRALRNLENDFVHQEVDFIGRKSEQAMSEIRIQL